MGIIGRRSAASGRVDTIPSKRRIAGTYIFPTTNLNTLKRSPSQTINRRPPRSRSRRRRRGTRDWGSPARPAVAGAGARSRKRPAASFFKSLDRMTCVLVVKKVGLPGERDDVVWRCQNVCDGPCSPPTLEHDGQPQPTQQGGMWRLRLLRWKSLSNCGKSCPGVSIHWSAEMCASWWRRGW